MLKLLLHIIDSSRNPDGGWGYAAGRASRLEPTALALAALAAAGRVADAGALSGWPHRDGWLLDPRDGDTFNVGFNAQALLAASVSRPVARGVSERVLPALCASKGVQLPPSEFQQQDNALQAWSWIPDTFSWVEPTAWSLLALKRWPGGGGRTAADGRIEEAERLLADRACPDGGWNYGNANVLGQQLYAYVPTTALALLALADRPAHPARASGLAWLVREQVSERSALALGLASLALSRYGEPVDEVHAALEAQWHETRFLGAVHATALAACALAGAAGPGGPFYV